MSNDGEESKAKCSSVDDELESPSKKEKRTFLEVNNAEKYKQFMLKPIETKRFKSSETLSRVRDFLPLLKQSTEKLMEDFKQNPDDVNIEKVDEEDEHIEMNLALVAQSESDSDEEDEEEEDSDEEEDEESENESSNSLDDLQLGFKVKDPNRIKKLKLSAQSELKAKNGLIQVIESNENSDSLKQEDSNMSESNKQ